MEGFPDSGFLSSRASQESPKFETLSFDWPSAPSVYDPVTGTFTAPTAGSRLVSALIGRRGRTGDVREHSVKGSLKAFIYVTHVGFEPLLGMNVTFRNVVYEVQGVSKAVQDKQWVLELEP
jgi:hypothetical protein